MPHASTDFSLFFITRLRKAIHGERERLTDHRLKSA